MFNPARLTLARQRRAKTKKELAGAIDVSPRMMSEYEAGRSEPNPERVLLLSQALGFPLKFFELDDPPGIAADGASFRSLSTMTAGQRHAATATGDLAVEFSRWLDRNFRIPSPDLLDLDLHAYGREEEAAAELRRHWELGERQIGSVLHLAESRGIRVFSLSGLDRRVGAFAFWDEDQPLVLVNTFKSAEGRRWDLCHEIGHLVLHRHGSPQGREAELQADRFASAFLMPRSSFIASAPRHASLPAIHESKVKWGVSAMAYVRRLFGLDLISDWHYHAMCRQLSQEGFRTREKDSSRRPETSQLLQKVIQATRGFSSIAADLGFPRQEVESLILGLAMTPLTGGAGIGEDSTGGPPRLHLVKG